VIRAATAGDAAALGDILQDWLNATPWMPKLHERVETHGFLGHVIATQRVFVAGDCSGFIALDGADISCLYLADAARGQGIGKALLDHAKSAQDQFDLWTFQANTGALRFYCREGFVEVERTDGATNDERLPDVRLSWTR